MALESIGGERADARAERAETAVVQLTEQVYRDLTNKDRKLLIDAYRASRTERMKDAGQGLLSRWMIRGMTSPVPDEDVLMEMWRRKAFIVLQKGEVAGYALAPDDEPEQYRIFVREDVDKRAVAAQLMQQGVQE